MENRADNEKVVTTVGDRLSTGLVNAAVIGGVVTLALGAWNKTSQLFTKKPRAFMGSTDWKIAGAITAVTGLYYAMTADKNEELNRERALEKAALRMNDPNTPGTQKEKETQFAGALGDILQDKIPEDLQAESTKFRDKVAQERAAGQAASHGVS